MTEMNKELRRRIRQGEIVQTRNGTLYWSTKLLGWNVRCRVCKEVKHKDDYIGRGFRACSTCRTSWVRPVACTPSIRIKRAKIEVRDYCKGHKRVIKKKNLVDDLRELRDENKRNTLL